MKLQGGRRDRSRRAAGRWSLDRRACPCQGDPRNRRAGRSASRAPRGRPHTGHHGSSPGNCSERSNQSRPRRGRA
jgi:hypothetical protein